MSRSELSTLNFEYCVSSGPVLYNKLHFANIMGFFFAIRINKKMFPFKG